MDWITLGVKILFLIISIESCVEELDIATGIWFGKEDEDADE